MGATVSGTVFTAIANKVYASSLKYHEPINSQLDKQSAIPISKVGNIDDIISVCNKLNLPLKIQEDLKNKWVNPIIKSNKEIYFSERHITKDKVPNVIGMTAKDALFLLENNGLVVKMKGYGSVINQSINPGTQIQQGVLIEIILG